MDGEFLFESREDPNVLVPGRRHEDLSNFVWEEQPMFNIPRILRPLGHDYICFKRHDRGLLQSDILQCRWCTNDRIRKQFPDLARLIITQGCVEAGYLPEEKEQEQELEKMLHYGGVSTLKRTRKQPKQGKEVDYCRVCVTKGEYVRLLYYRDLSDLEKGLWESESRSDSVPLLDVMELPPFLFRTNVNTDHREHVQEHFTDARLRLLGTILYSGGLSYNNIIGSVDSISYPRDALQQGVRTAITTTNPRVLDILLQLDSVIHFELGTYYKFPPYHFRTAAQVYLDINDKHNDNASKNTENADINKIKDDAFLCFLLLLTTSAESVPCDDPVVTHFAKTVGGAFGGWLLNLMKLLPEHVEILTEAYQEAEEEDSIPMCNVLFSGRMSSPFREFGGLGITYTRNVVPTSELYKIPTRWLMGEKPSYLYE